MVSRAIVLTQPGIPNNYALSTTCYGNRLKTIGDQAFAAVAMGFRKLEIGLADEPVPLNGFEDSRRETGIAVGSLVAGCLNPRCEQPSGTKLGSLDEDLRERALNSLRRHIRLAHHYSCNKVIIRGCAVEDPALCAEADRLHARLVREGASEELAEEARGYVTRLHKKSHRQIEHLCRSLHSLLTEFPETRLALEPGSALTDLVNFDSMGWILDDLSRHGLGYWHDSGRVHQRERFGLSPQGRWLDTYADRMVGIHLQDSSGEEMELPPGTGEVDFKLIASYLSRDAERVLEIKPRHGRAEILSAVQFLVDLGF
jgi:sugar phosphate isomerase/epimerase